MKVAISMCDGTRAQPRDKMIPAVLDELGVPDEDVVILVATGTHRGNTDEEIRAMLGDELVERVRVVNHDARDKATLTFLGEHGDGVPVWINREWVAGRPAHHHRLRRAALLRRLQRRAEARHARPGRAWRPCSCCTTRTRIGDPKATWGVIDDNPVHEDIRAAAAAAPPHFTLRRDPQPRAAGDRGLRGRARPDARAPPARPRGGSRCGPVPEPFDVVVTSNSGYPLDQNLYQAVKGMSAAAKVVKPGGLIVCAAECRDGFPGHGSYRQLLEAQHLAARLPAPDRASPTTSRRTSGRSRSRPTSRTTRAS